MVRVCAIILALLVQPEGSALRERLDAFDERTSEIEDLSANFEQQKHSVLLRKPIVSRGTVRVKGDAIRWDTREPVRSVIRVDVTDARIYYPDQKLLEIYALGADLRFLAGSPAPKMSALRERFEIAEADGEGLDDVGDHLVVSLTPRDERLAERIERVRLVLDEDAGVMRQFEMVDPQGDRTVIIFKKSKLNQGLTDDDVALETPEGVEISRPFGETPEDEQDGG